MRPRIGKGVFIAPGAQVIGDVEIGDESSVWFNAVVRGDVDRIRVGHHTNIQDASVCHAMRHAFRCVIGDYVTVGHGSVLHGCSVESRCLIGMRSTILNDVRIGEGSIVAAGSLITEGTVVPPRSLVMGMPARVTRPVTDAEILTIGEYARRYCEYKENYLGGNEDD